MEYIVIVSFAWPPADMLPVGYLITTTEEVAAPLLDAGLITPL